MLGTIICLASSSWYDETWRRYFDRLEPVLFADRRNLLVYETMKSLVDRQVPPHIDALGVALEGKQEGIVTYASGLDDDATSPLSIPWYIDRLREHAARRKLRGLLDRARQVVDDPEATLEDAVALALRAEEASVPDEDACSEVSVAEAWREIEREQEGLNSGVRLEFGLESLDKRAPIIGELTIIAGRPSMGKTALAVSLAERLAIRDRAVLFLSLEMSARAIQRRRLSVATGITLDRMSRRGALEKHDWDVLTGTVEKLRKRPLYVISGSFTPEKLASEIRRQRAVKKIDAVFVDHLGLVDYRRDTQRRDLEIGEVTKRLARLAKGLGITVFVLSQLNRSLEHREKKIPVLSDLRDSGRIEEDADLVWMIYRRGYYKPEEDDQSFVINVAKNRNGPTGPVNIKFDKTTGRFWE